MVVAYILLLLIACFAYVSSEIAAHYITQEVCPVCGSIDVQEINGHIVCGNCGTMLAGCCEGGPM